MSTLQPRYRQHGANYPSATVTMLLKAFCFSVVRPSVTEVCEHIL